MEYLLKDKDGQCPKKKKSAERIRWKADGIAEDVNTGPLNEKRGICLQSEKNLDSRESPWGINRRTILTKVINE